MKILGIDPGIATTGYGVIDVLGNRFELVDYGVFKTSPEDSLSRRLMHLHEQLSSYIGIHSPQHVSVEELFFNTNAKTALIVGQARGVILLTAEKLGLEATSYTPLQVKSAVCGYGRADKKQVQSMVQRLLNLKAIPKPDDAADALGLAICHAHSYKVNSYAQTRR